MKKVVKQDASPTSNLRRSSRDLSADNSRGKKVTRNENITPKKKTITPNASPASSSRRSSTSSRKQTKETPPTNMRKSARLENKNPSDTPQSKEKTNKTTPVIDRRNKLVKSLDQSMTDTSKNNGQEKPSLGAGGRKRKRGKKTLFSRVKQKKAVADGDKAKDSKETSSEAITCSSSDVEDNLHPLDSNKTEYSVSKSVEDKDDECSDRKASKSQCGEEKINVNELLKDYLMDLDKAKHVGCHSSKSVECGSGEGSSSESEKSPKKQKTNHGSGRQHELKYCDTSISEDRTTCEAPGLAEIVEKIWDTRNVEVSDAQGLQKQKEYFVKYKGVAHIHNQWVTETRLLLDAPLLVASFSTSGSIKWSEEWTVPHKLLKKRLLLSLKPLYESQKNKGKVLNYHYEWLVQWQGLDYEQATWESENISVLDSPQGHNLVKEYEKRHKNARMSSSSDDKIEEVPLKLPTLPAGCSLGMDNIHLSYIKNLRDAWNRGQISIVFDDQERTMRIALFIYSLKDVTLPFLLITTADSLSQWEAMFSKVASCNAFKTHTEGTEGKRSFKLVEVKKEGGQLAFQLVLYPVDAFVKDLNMLKAIQWQAVIVDESQSSEISSHFSCIKSLSTVKWLLVFCGPLGVNMTSYLDVLSKLDLDVISKTELDDMSKLKETLSNLIAYECKSNSSKFVEFRVPVQISNVQLEQYCSMLLSNAMALSSCSKTDTVGAVHDILVSNRKCCDHPYIADQSLQFILTKGLDLAKFLDVGIKASGKLQFLDLILPELRKRKLRVLILYQPLSGSGKDSASIGDILDDFLRQRFGEDSYERIDGVGIVPSKKQTALNNFNNKDMGRFVFLLEYRACLPSIKLSSVDTVVVFNSEWNPANDLRALNKIAIDSQSEQIMIFRLYTSSTLEEKILRLAEHNVTIDSKLQNISRSTSDALLMWGATYLFNKLDEFHNASGVNTCSEECLLDELLEEFVNLITHVRMNKDATKLITRAQPVCEIYGKNPREPNKTGGEQPHTFWRKLLVGRNPCWKYLAMSNPRQRKSKRPQYIEQPPEKITNDDVSRKRKKTTNNITESVALKPVTEEGEVVGANRSQSSAGDSFWSDAPTTSFHDLLKLKISKLCEALGLSEDVKTTVERFLEYVIENYHVNNEDANTLQAFLISLCWSGSDILKHKLDRTQSVALANEHLNFSCNEEETRQIYLKLESAKEMFIRYTKNQKKTYVSEDSIPETEPTSMQLLEVKEEVPDSPTSQYNDNVVDCNHIDAEFGTINPDASDALENQNDSHNLSNSNSPSAGVPKENTPKVQCVVSPASGQSVPTDPEIQKETTQENDVQVNSPSLAETSCLQTIGAGKVDQLNPEGSSLQLGMGQCSPSVASPQVAEIQSTITSDEQRSDSYSADKVDCQPSNKPPSPSQNLSASSQVSETSARFPNPAVTPRGSNLLHVRRDNHNQGVSRPYSDPLQNELEKLCELKNNISKFHEVVKLKLKSDHEKELAEVIAEMNRKYEAKCQDAEAAFQSKRVEIDTSFNKVVKNKMLADAYRSKCQDMSPFDPAILRVQSGGMRFQGQPSMGRSASLSPAQVSRIPQQPPHQIVHQSANLFTSTPTRPLSYTNPSSIPIRPPQSTSIPSTTPTRPPYINPITPSTRPPSTTGPINTPSRPPPGVSPLTPSIRLNINPITPSNRPPPNINTITPSSRPPNINPIIPSSRPPPCNNPTTGFTRTPRAISEVRAPAPHIRPFTPSTSTSPHNLSSHRMMSSLHASSPTSQSSTRPPHSSPLQTPPHLQTNQNGHPTQNSPSTQPFSSLLAAQTSSQSPAASLALPPLYSWHPSEQLPPSSLPAMSSSLPQTSLPPMPSISISNTGLYSASGGSLNVSLSALDLLMDIDKKAKFHQQPNTLPSQPEFSDATEFGKEGGSSDPVCLSDDD